MYIYTCIQNRNCRQHSYGFKNLMSSWGLGTQFSKSPLVGEFSIFGSKSKVFQKHMRSQAFFSKIWCYLRGWGRVGTQHGLTCFWVQKFIFWGSGGHKIWVLLGGFNFRLSNHNVPPGSSANPYARGPKGRVWWDGLDGLDGISKVSFKILHTL